MRTLVELYDERPLENVLSTQVFSPERTVYVCPKSVMNSPRARDVITRYLTHKGYGGEIIFRGADMFSARDVLWALEEISAGYEDCVLDITGGTDAALFAAGLFSARYGSPAFTYSRRENRFYSIKDAPFGEIQTCSLKLSVEDCFVMAGGCVKQGRVDNGILEKYLSYFDPFFAVYLRYRQDWTRLVGWMQRASAPKEGVISLEVDSPYYVKGDRSGMVRPSDGALYALNDLGFISGLTIEGTSRVRFRFMDLQVRAWLRDIGSVLETYVYRACLDTGAFDGVCTSVVVDWEGDGRQSNVTNEIDVMAVKGVMPVFISCKTCEIKTEALNELAVLRDRFGGKIARAAIVSASKCQAVTRHRAAELDISVIELEDLKCGRLKKRLKALTLPKK